MTQWHWQFSSREAASELGSAPERHLETSERIKFNPIRDVYRGNGCYMKLDKRKGHHLSREWSSAMMLKAKSIPTVEHLAIGTSEDDGELLITRELPSSMTVRDYVRALPVGDKGAALAIAEKTAHFTRLLVDSHVFHPDYHSGNLLYVPETGQLTLVDVCGIRKATLWDRLFWRYRMEGILLLCGLRLDRTETLNLFRMMNDHNPEKAYRRVLKDKAEHVFHAWDKRSAQIMKGHHRYTILQEGWLHAVDDNEVMLPSENAELLRGDGTYMSARLFLAHFLLNYAGIPHRAAIAFSPNTGDLLLENRQDKTPLTTLPPHFADRMEAFGIPWTPEQWYLDSSGRPYLYDLSTAAEVANK